MKKNRRTVVTVLLGGVLLAGAGVVVWWRTGPTPLRATFDQVRLGEPEADILRRLPHRPVARQEEGSRVLIDWEGPPGWSLASSRTATAARRTR